MNSFQFSSNREVYKAIAEAVVNMDEHLVTELAHYVLEHSIPPKEAILNGLSEGMWQVGEQYEKNIYFIPEVLMCADAMYAGFNILKECVSEDEITKDVKIVIGVVDGDFHDIGKNIVSLMMQSAGYRVVDLGANVPQEKFIGTVEAQKPDILALSTLMSTTMEEIEKIIRTIRREFNGACPKIMIGGAPVNEQFRQTAGADFYGEDAKKAVSGVLQLTG